MTAVLTGGVEEPRTGSLEGPMAVQAARSFLYNTFLSSAAALDHEFGSSELALADSAVKRAFSQNLQRVVLAVDHSKPGTRAQARARPSCLSKTLTEAAGDRTARCRDALL